MKRHDNQAALALQSVPFFSNLQNDEVNELAGRLVLRRFGIGQVIFHHGDPGGLLYIISHGKVKITHSTPEGQEALLAILGSGDFLANWHYWMTRLDPRQPKRSNRQRH